MASPVNLCYDEESWSWRRVKQWTAYGRWLEKTYFGYQRIPGNYIRRVIDRVEREGNATCDEIQSIAQKLAYKYSARPLASIAPYKSTYCKCKLTRCNKPVHFFYEEIEEIKASSKKAMELARKNNVPHCALPQYRKEYPVCRICNASFVKHEYHCCGNRSCKLLERMASNGLLDRKKEGLPFLFCENNMSDFVEICYLTAVIERFMARKRPKHLNQFFKRYKGFQNVTKQN
jgi:hypothetical protein